MPKISLSEYAERLERDTDGVMKPGERIRLEAGIYAYLKTRGGPVSEAAEKALGWIRAKTPIQRARLEERLEKKGWSAGYIGPARSYQTGLMEKAWAEIIAGVKD